VCQFVSLYQRSVGPISSKLKTAKLTSSPLLMPLKTFEDLEIWKRGCRLSVDIYLATEDSNDFRLKAQMQSAAVSISSNIAEGAERDSTKDFARFLRYSKGSCAELRTQLFIAQRVRKELNKPDLKNANHLIKETRELASMIQSLINSLESTSL
jgi:four helix bundle protein